MPDVNEIIHDIGGALYNVKHPDYVAMKVGTDWTPAIQGALDAAAVAGGVVYLPPGTYATTAPLTVATNVRLEGAGWGAVISYSPTAANQSAVLLDGVAGAAVRSLKVINNGAKAVNRVNQTVTHAGGACVEVRDSELCVVEDVYAQWGSAGVWLNNTVDAPETESWTTNRHHRVQGCVAREQGGYGFYVVRGYACSLLGNDSGGCSSDGFKTTRRNRLLRIEANHSQGNGRDGYDFFDGLLESVVCGNVSRDNSLFGYEVKGTLDGDDIGNDDYVVRDSIISSNLASGNGGTGFAITSIRNTAFVGNLAVSNGASEDPALLSHDGFTLTNLQGVDVTGCVASKNTQHGFHAQSTARALFSGCVAVDNSYADGTTQNGSFDGFNVDSTSTAQIVGGRAFNGTVAGHKGGQRYAVNFGGATSSLVDGFDASGNVTGAVNGRTGNLVTDYINHTATRLGAENDTSDALALTPRQRLRSKTLTVNSATPSVADANKAATANTAATTLTNFASGVDGQILFFRAGDGSTTIQHGTNIFLKGGATKAFAMNETAVFAYDGTIWYQYA
jgi:hypothetical protein